ncbi:aldehyde dehydrogenase family protein [Pseudomonas lini]
MDGQCRSLSRRAVGKKIPLGSAADADAAVACAKRAMTVGPWARMSATERGKIMRRIGDLTLEHIDLLAELEVRDNGKLFAEMRGAIKKASRISGTTTRGSPTKSRAP